MSEQDFEAAFEEFAPQVLEVAWNFVDQASEINRIVVGIMQHEGMSVAIPAYEVSGERRRCHLLTDIGVDCSQAAQLDMLMQMSELSDEFVDEIASSTEFPSLIVIDYDVPKQEMKAEFHYDELQPGVSEAEQLPFDSILREWIERWVATGDESFLAHDPDTWQQWRTQL